MKKNNEANRNIFSKEVDVSELSKEDRKEQVEMAAEQFARIIWEQIQDQARKKVSYPLKPSDISNAV